ncbi:MAG TPA: efflux RND transporter periplasmic adaptor subunit [Rhodanobacteraceae bacterium]|nr:efflux RND transporter periplasmic adaptor subunit [Rhodanobacteraceae bacterium]
MATRAEYIKQPSTKKRMILMIIGVVVLIAIIAGIKVLLVMRMIASFPKPPPAVVTTATAQYQPWQPALSAVGTLRAVQGADLALDVSGLVTAVNLKSGDEVKKGQVLLQLRDSEDVAQLHQLQAAAALAKVTFERARQQLAVQAISKADYDNAAADYKAKQAAVAQQEVNVDKKQLRAPFDGRAGIITVNPGAYLNAGTTIVTVQQMDPLYVDFYVPQRELSRLHPNQKVALSLDAFGKREFDGEVTAINPKVDNDTRNVLVEATVPNKDDVLTPGMFANVSVDVGGQTRYLTLPQTAIVYNPYGETVYVVMTEREFEKVRAEEAAKNGNSTDAGAPKSDGKQQDKSQTPPPDTLVVRQTFVTTGQTRGDQVAIVSGIQEGTQVVTSGQLKLKNGAPIKVDNKFKPADNPNPTPQED